MTYSPITPFCGTVADIGLSLDTAKAAPLPDQAIDKWDILRETTAARQRLGVSDRELAVLQVLLTFYPHRALSPRDIVVFPSNQAICARLNGMPCSTMRRRLSGLVRAGLIARRDSPNGKRYARRYGDAAQAFGFDLSPLLHRYGEICALAQEIRDTEQDRARLRQSLSLMRRDLRALIDYGRSLGCNRPLWDKITLLIEHSARLLRRQLGLDPLREIEAQLSDALALAQAALTPKTPKMSSKADENEQHHQKSDKDIYDSDSCIEPTQLDHDTPPPQATAKPQDTALPLALVLRACPQIEIFGNRPVRRWYDLIAAADRVYGMMGISPSAWADATRVMGREQAAIVIAAMLERIESITTPGGYLRHLTRRAQAGAFTCSSMVRALLNRSLTQCSQL